MRVGERSVRTSPAKAKPTDMTSAASIPLTKAARTEGSRRTSEFGHVRDSDAPEHALARCLSGCRGEARQVEMAYVGGGQCAPQDGGTKGRARVLERLEHSPIRPRPALRRARRALLMRRWPS